jgi:hypothetical protein
MRSARYHLWLPSKKACREYGDLCLSRQVWWNTYGRKLKLEKMKARRAFLDSSKKFWEGIP